MKGGRLSTSCTYKKKRSRSSPLTPLFAPSLCRHEVGRFDLFKDSFHCVVSDVILIPRSEDQATVFIDSVDVVPISRPSIRV